MLNIETKIFQRSDGPKPRYGSYFPHIITAAVSPPPEWSPVPHVSCHGKHGRWHLCGLVPIEVVLIWGVVEKKKTEDFRNMSPFGGELEDFKGFQGISRDFGFEMTMIPIWILCPGNFHMLHVDLCHLSRWCCVIWCLCHWGFAKAWCSGLNTST